MNVRTLALPLLALSAAAGIWWFAGRDAAAGVPAATWRVGPTDDFHQARPYEELAAETPIRLSMHCDAPRHVYVFSHSAEDGTLLLHPSPAVRGAVANPLPAGRTLLPGERDGTPLSWTTRHHILATTTFVVVAADRPLPELEALLPKLRRWTNTALTDGTMAVTMPGGDVELTGAARTGWPHPLLQRAANRGSSETIVNGPLHADAEIGGVWTSSWRVKEKPGTAKDTMEMPVPMKTVPGVEQGAAPGGGK